ncbi:MAG: tyrosine protein phosphatase [Myxococcota bacterium]
MIELGLENEPELARSLGLDYVSIPIRDREQPDSVFEFLRALRPATDAFLSGSSVVAHCRAGIGRSTLVVSSLLLQAGLHAHEALARIEKSRGRPVPDTEEQRAWVHALERILRFS